MNATVDVYGLRVNQARVIRAMTVTAVMEALGWKHSRLNRVERAATTALPVEDFEQFAAVLRFPPKFFTTAPTSRVHSSDLLFRAPRSITATEREYLAQFAALTGEFLDELPPPPAAGTESSIIAALRTRLGAKDDQISDLRTELRQRDNIIAILQGELDRLGART